MAAILPSSGVCSSSIGGVTGPLKLLFSYDHCCNCAQFNVRYKVYNNKNEIISDQNYGDINLNGCGNIADPKGPRDLILGEEDWAKIKFSFICLSKESGQCREDWKPVGCHTGATGNIFSAITNKKIASIVLDTNLEPEITNFACPECSPSTSITTCPWSSKTNGWQPDDCPQGPTTFFGWNPGNQPAGPPGVGEPFTGCTGVWRGVSSAVPVTGFYACCGGVDDAAFIQWPGNTFTSPGCLPNNCYNNTGGFIGPIPTPRGDPTSCYGAHSFVFGYTFSVGQNLNVTVGDGSGGQTGFEIACCRYIAP